MLTLSSAVIFASYLQDAVFKLKNNRSVQISHLLAELSPPPEISPACEIGEIQCTIGEK